MKQTKIVLLVLSLCMLFGMLGLTVSAETAVPYTQDGDTLTVSGRIKDDNGIDWDNVTNIVLTDDCASFDATDFDNAINATAITVANGNKNYSSVKGVLYSENGTNLLYCPQAITDFEIPDGVTHLSMNCFRNSKLTQLTIPKGVQYISYPFYGCDITEITVDTENAKFCAVGNVLYNKDQTRLLLCGKGNTDLVIPGSVTEIDMYAFMDCKSLKNVTIPEGVEEIGFGAFYGCTALVGTRGDINVVANGKLVIPESVTKIGMNAFGGCTALNVVHFAGNAPAIEEVGGLKTFPERTEMHVLPNTTGWNDGAWASYTKVVKNQVSGITLDKSALTVKVGESAQLTASVSPIDAYITDIKWTSADSEYVTVDENGNIEVLKYGKDEAWNPMTVTVTATATDGSGVKATCVITLDCNHPEYQADGETSNRTIVNDIATCVKEGFINGGETFYRCNDCNMAMVFATGFAMLNPEPGKGLDSNNHNKKSVTVTKEPKDATEFEPGNKAEYYCKDCEQTYGGEVIPAWGTEVESITISRASLQFNKIDSESKQQLTVTLTPDKATDQTITWTTDKPEVAEVDANGIVTAVGNGTAMITATTHNGKTATCVVTVHVPVTGVALNTSTVNLSKNGTTTLTATVSPDTAENKKVTWTSNDEIVAKVDENGLVTALAKGTAVITATTEDGKKTASCTVTVTDPSGISVTDVAITDNGQTVTSLEMLINAQKTLSAKITPDNATDKAVTWSLGGNSVLTITDGVVKAIGVGTETITVTTVDGGKTATCTVTVTCAHGETTVINKKDATYTTEGNTGDTKCTICNEIIARGTNIPRLDPPYVPEDPTPSVPVDPKPEDPKPEEPKPEVWENPYEDISEEVIADEETLDAIQFVTESGLMIGTHSDPEHPTFSPDMTLTRSQFVTILGRMAEIDVTKYTDAPAFSDVPTDEWYTPYVLWASENGIILGYGDGTFGPQDIINVEQALAILARFAKLEGLDVGSDEDLSAYSDTDAISDWAIADMRWALENGIYTVDGAELNPLSNTARLMTAIFVYRYAMLTAEL